MRVTENSSFDFIRDASNRAKSKMENLQTQVSTMKKLNTPSDDPVGAAKVLEVRTDKVNNEQYLTNSKIAQSFLENSDHALSEISDVLVRAKEIAIGQSSGASANRDTRVAVAEEVLQLFQQAIAAGNRRVGDRYIFGGYKTEAAPVDPTGAYKGDEGSMMVEVGRDVYVSMNVPGKNIFSTEVVSTRKPEETRILASQETLEENAGEKTGGIPKSLNVFQELQDLRISLLTGDLEAIQSSLDHLDSLHAHINAGRAKIGARVNGILNLSQGLERQAITQAQLTSQIEDADLSKTVSDLAQQEMVYKSALQASQRLIQPTLLDFLK